MGTPQLTAEQVAQVPALVAQYIFAQHNEYVRLCGPLTPEQQAAMEGFFSPNLLDGVGIIRLDGHRIANPSFYPMLEEMGFANLPDFSQMAATTFSDVVVSPCLSPTGSCSMNWCMSSNIADLESHASRNFMYRDFSLVGNTMASRSKFMLTGLGRSSRRILGSDPPSLTKFWIGFGSDDTEVIDGGFKCLGSNATSAATSPAR